VSSRQAPQDHAVAHAADVGAQISSCRSPSHEAQAARRGQWPHYHFIDRKRFDQLVKNGELLEYAKCSQRLRHAAKARGAGAQAGHDVLFDIDLQGTQQLRERARDDLVSVFIPAAIDRRVGAAAAHSRADDKRVIRARMAKAGDEMSHWAEYDYVVVNRDLDRRLAMCARSLPPSG